MVREERSAFKVTAGAAPGSSTKWNKAKKRPGSETTSVVEKMSYLHPGRSRGVSLALCHSFSFFPARETVCVMSELFSAAGPWRSAAGWHARRWKKAGGAVSLPGSSLIPAFLSFSGVCMFLNAGLRWVIQSDCLSASVGMLIDVKEAPKKCMGGKPQDFLHYFNRFLPSS